MKKPLWICIISLALGALSFSCSKDSRSIIEEDPLPRDLTDPLVTAVEGSFKKGETITLKGEDFGTHTMDIEWTGDRIENEDVDVNPDTWENWIHRYQLQGKNDHITDQMSWSGQKSMDLTVDQEKHCNGGPCESTLSYVTGEFEKIFISYWFRFDGIAATQGYTAKHMWITCLDCGTNVAFGTVRNTFAHTGQVGTDGISNSWGTWVGSLMRCEDNELFQGWEPYKNATGIGYDVPENPSMWWGRNMRGATEHLPKFVYNENEWVRMDYYYDRGDWDEFNGEMRLATFRPEGQGTFEPGLHISKWLDNVLLKSKKPGCFETDGDPAITAPEIVGIYLFTDNPPGETNSAHTKYWVDDFYVQTGTRARVEMGNSPNYETATRLEIQPPVSWSDGEIEFKLNYGGSFEPGDTAFIYVINENEYDQGNRDAHGNGSYDFAGVSPGFEIELE